MSEFDDDDTGPSNDYIGRKASEDSVKTLGIVVGLLAALGIGSCAYVVGKDLKERINQKSEATKNYNLMQRIADDLSLHPSYGNNNGEFEVDELAGVCRDLQIALKVGDKIPYELIQKYNGMYSKK